MELLFQMSVALNYPDIDKADLKRNIYRPEGLAQLELDQRVLLKGMAMLLEGQITLPVSISSVPIDPEVAKKQSEVLDKLASMLNGDRAIKIRSEND